jgi:hypothetical protein
VLKDPETRDAYAIVRADKARMRKERKEAARQHIRAIVATKAPGQREPRERDNGYLQSLRRLPCAVCGSTPCDAAHLRFQNLDAGRVNPGMGKKPHDRHAVNLCRACHTDQHANNEKAWWAAHRMDPDALAAGLYAAFLAGGDMAAVVQEYRPAVRAKKPEDGRRDGVQDALETPPPRASGRGER